MFIYWISGESGCLVSSTDASKVVGQKFITHADYKALENASAKLEAEAARYKAALQSIAERHSDKSVDGQIARTALAHNTLEEQ